MTDLEEMAYPVSLPHYDLDRATRIPRSGYTACIVAHPARMGDSGLAHRAIRSVLAQTRQPAAIILMNDTAREGAAAGRQRCLDAVDTEWMAWLDSDDEWYPQHAEKLLATAEATGAVFVYPWFDAPSDPLGHFGLPFNPATPHHTTITFLARTELARRVGFGTGFDTLEAGQRFAGEDWLHITGMCRIAAAEGLPMVHLAERTWYWHMNGQNSSGVPGQGDAV